jgi:hypothetical protein
VQFTLSTRGIDGYARESLYLPQPTWGSLLNRFHSATRKSRRGRNEARQDAQTSSPPLAASLSLGNARARVLKVKRADEITVDT